MRRPGEEEQQDRSRVTTAVLAAAVTDPRVVARFRSKIVQVDGTDCAWWTGAVSGRGHGRFWVAGNLVVIAHRFAYALHEGVHELHDAPVLGHQCDNPLCQRVGPGHITPSSIRGNRRDWSARRRLAGSPLGDPRGARRRARALRDLARLDPELVLGDLEQTRQIEGEQPHLPGLA